MDPKRPGPSAKGSGVGMSQESEPFVMKIVDMPDTLLVEDPYRKRAAQLGAQQKNKPFDGSFGSDGVDTEDATKDERNEMRDVRSKRRRSSLQIEKELADVMKSFYDHDEAEREEVVEGDAPPEDLVIEPELPRDRSSSGKRDWRYYYKKEKFPVSFPEEYKIKKRQYDEKRKRFKPVALPWDRWEKVMARAKRRHKAQMEKAMKGKGAPKRAAEAAAKDAEHSSDDYELTVDETDQISRIFALFDLNNDGSITLEEMRKIMEETVDQYSSNWDVKKWFSTADSDHDNKISPMEFQDAMRVYFAKEAASRRDQVDEARKATALSFHVQPG